MCTSGILVLGLVYAAAQIACPGGGHSGLHPSEAGEAKASVAYWQDYLARPHPDPAEIRRMFARAAAEFNVPAEILMAVGQVETNWTQIGPSIDRGWGIMHLVRNADVDTLGLAAKLLDVEPQTLKDNAETNIRGAAALLAHFAGPDQKFFGRLEDWFDAAAELSGLATGPLRRLQAARYYRALRDGAKGSTCYGGVVELPGHKGVVVPQDVSRAKGDSPDYGEAWLDLTPCNYTAGRNHPIDTWVNHWIGVGTAAGAVSWFHTCRGSDGSSAHFVIANDGTITQVVHVADTAWHCGAYGYPYNNHRSIGIEHEATLTNPDLWNSPAMLEASARMAAYFTDLYGIPRQRSLPGVQGHNDMPGTATGCPGNLPWATWFALLEGDTGLGYACELEVGDRVRVANTNGTGLNVRACGSTDCYAMGNAADGTKGVLLAGPVPSGGYDWWQVDWEGEPLGWSAQGYDATEWINPDASRVQIGETIPVSGSLATVGTSFPLQIHAELDAAAPGVIEVRLLGGGALLDSDSASVAEPGEEEYALEVVANAAQVGETNYTLRAIFRPHASAGPLGEPGPCDAALEIEYTVDWREAAVLTAPKIPAGPAQCEASDWVMFSTGDAVLDPEGPVEYRIHWGDGQTSAWSASANYTHMWSAPGSYEVQAEARGADNPLITALSALRNIKVFPKGGIEEPPPGAVSMSGLGLAALAGLGALAGLRRLRR